LTRFVILGDLHYSTAYLNAQLIAEREQFFDMLFTSVRKQNPDYVFAIGDVADEGMEEELAGIKAAAARNGVEMIIVTGNHDLYQMNQKEWHTINGTDILRRIDSPEISFLLLETAKFEDGEDQGGYMPKEQLKWLATQLKEAQAKNLAIVVLGHHPLLETTYLSMLPGRYIANSEELQGVFDLVMRPAIYCNGHNHCHSLVKKDNWLYVQTAAPLQTADYRLIEFTPQQITVQTIDLEKEFPEVPALALKLAEALFWTPIPAFKGQSQDREIILDITLTSIIQLN